MKMSKIVGTNANPTPPNWNPKTEVYEITVFIQIDAPGVMTKFWEGATFKNKKISIFMLT